MVKGEFQRICLCNLLRSKVYEEEELIAVSETDRIFGKETTKYKLKLEDLMYH